MDWVGVLNVQRCKMLKTIYENINKVLETSYYYCEYILRVKVSNII